MGKCSSCQSGEHKCKSPYCLCHCPMPTQQTYLSTEYDHEKKVFYIFDEGNREVRLAESEDFNNALLIVAKCNAMLALANSNSILEELLRLSTAFVAEAEAALREQPDTPPDIESFKSWVEEFKRVTAAVPR